MNLLAFLSSIIVGAFTLAGVWFTKRDVKTVRAENTYQHAAAGKQRDASLSIVLDRVEVVRTDVRDIADTVSVLGFKLEDHITSPH